jgi:Abortive infection C-terminus
MAEAVPPSFVMHGARAAMAGGLTHIEEQIKGIERAVIENPGLAFDLAKTVVESACRTILVERKITFAPDDDLPRLYKAVTTNLPMLPIAASGEAEARKSLVQTLNGLHTALQGVCELRNAYGFASHGADGPRPLMESVQALLAAQAADAIVGFLHRVHRQERGPVARPRIEYKDNEDFNTYVDETHEPVKIFDLAYRPSEVLFAVDHEAYRNLLADYEPGEDDAPDEGAPESTGKAP